VIYKNVSWSSQKDLGHSFFLNNSFLHKAFNATVVIDLTIVSGGLFYILLGLSRSYSLYLNEVLREMGMQLTKLKEQE